MSDRKPFKAWLVLFGYVLIPAIIIGRTIITYPELPTTHLLGMMISAVSVGLVLVLICLASAHFPRGSYSRLGLNLCFVVGVVVWFLALLGWSTTLDMTYNGYSFQLELTNYLYFLMMVGVLNAAYYIAEAKVYHGHEMYDSDHSLSDRMHSV